MPRLLNRLSARTVETRAAPGRHADGGGLYLFIGKDGSRRWVFVWRRGGRWREMGLGSVLAIPLERAQLRAREATPTFGQVAETVLANVEAQARNSKHAAQWRMTLTRYAKPLWTIPVDQIETRDVLAVLKDHWLARPETARHGPRSTDKNACGRFPPTA